MTSEVLAARDQVEESRVVESVVDAATTLGQDAGDVVETLASETAKRLRDKQWVSTLARVGWLAKGVVYAGLGWAALDISLNQPDPVGATYTGLITALGTDPVSRALLVAITAGLFFYVTFRLISVALIDDVDLDSWAHRVGYMASAITYITVGWAAVNAIVVGSEGEGGESALEEISKRLLESSGGRIALTLAGIVAFIIAGYFGYKGISRRFMGQVDVTNASDIEARAIEVAGAIGWVGRAFTVAAVAGFVTWSAIDADPNDVRGLDSSMNRIADTTGGSVLVFSIAMFLFVYAFYCGISARYRRLAWKSNPEPDQESPA